MKKTVYIHALEGSLIALVIFGSLAYFLPTPATSPETELILTISTFLFAIMSGFLISRLNRRYNEVTSTVAREDALILNLYKISANMGTKFQNKIKSLLDNYYIEVMDSEIGGYYKETAPYFLKTFDEVNNVKIGKDMKKETAYDHLLGTVSDIEITRNSAASLYLEKLQKGQWAIVIALAIIISTSIFYIKTDGLVSGIIATVLSTILVMTILIMRDLENFRLGGKLVYAESSQEVLEFMGLKRYYNKKFISEESMLIPKSVKEYRLGSHEAGQKRKIKIVKNR